MTDKKQYTKGTWRAGNTDITTKETFVANCFFGSRNFRQPSFDEALANVQLIVTAVNQCVKLNPTNPAAVAKNIEAMHKELMVVSGTLMALINSKTVKPETFAIATRIKELEQVLTAIEAKE